MEVVFETERLLLRKFTNNDAALIFQLGSDAEVTKYTQDHITTLAEAENILLNIILPQYTNYNMGRWAVHTKSDLKFLGWCGLKYNPETDENDLGYRFIKTEWGKGFAYECARSTIAYGLETLKLECITGRADENNAASIRVLEKCGMQNIGVQITPHCNAVTFKIGKCKKVE